MKILNSLRFRITVAFATFAAVLSIIYGIAVWWGAVVAEDAVFTTRLDGEIAAFKREFARDPEAKFPRDRFIRSYLGKQALPERLRRVVTHNSGIVELKDENFYVAATPHDGDTLYVVQDVQQLEILDGLAPRIYLAALFAGLIAIAVALWLGGMISSRVIAPVVSLAGIFRNRSPGTLPRNFASSYYDDEIGFLANTLEEQISRIEDFVEHEVRFSRDASHELRTPVTSIKLALDLISEVPDEQSPGLAKALDRIGRANSDMEHLINTLLWLSRERRKLERAGPVTGPQDEALILIRQCVESHRSLISTKPVDVEIVDQTTAPRLVYRDLFSIAAGNLIRNAFQYTEQGQVTVTLTDDSVTVIDTGRGLSGDAVQKSEPRGFGFGLELVRRICHRCGWHFDADDAPTQGTRATIHFASAFRSADSAT